MQLDQITKNLPTLLAAVFIAILFIQSAMDKLTDWKGNREFLTAHFAKTFLAPMVPMMLATITLMELVTGLLAAAGVFYFLASGSLALVFYASILGALAVIALFFGQRVAKDYPGAAVLVPYFILLLIIIHWTRQT
ncbi:MAG TPA: hypothetical protein VNA17_06870 [Pyrinomonadaceae bacterium]|nr:hypothetical protein [Pyrinomonadaceae bacterium]